jgi:hypothetical protein
MMLETCKVLPVPQDPKVPWEFKDHKGSKVHKEFKGYRVYKDHRDLKEFKERLVPH